jgi:glycosyltransferase involved in cell wall biosynthesis
MDSNKKRVLFVYTRNSTFIRGDMDIMSHNFIVTKLVTDNTNPAKQTVALIKQFFYLIFNIYKFNIVYIWFADYHSWLPALFAKITRKRCYIVIGGYDVCRVKKYKYGSFVKPLRGWLARSSMKMSTANLCVSEHVKRVVKRLAPQTPIKLVYNGITFPDSSKTKLPAEGTRNGVLCVAISNTKQSIFVKGIDRYLALAQAMPSYQFTLIGTNPAKAGIDEESIPKNLTIITSIEHNLLSEYYHKSKVYCQLSRRESFSLALAEAMFHGCMPLTTKAGGMPEVSGGLGEIIYALDNDGFDRENRESSIHEAINAIARLSAESEDYAPAMRERVTALFTIGRRERELNSIFFQNNRS